VSTSALMTWATRPCYYTSTPPSCTDSASTKMEVHALGRRKAARSSKSSADCSRFAKPSHTIRAHALARFSRVGFQYDATGISFSECLGSFRFALNRGSRGSVFNRRISNNSAPKDILIEKDVPSLSSVQWKSCSSVLVK